MGVGQKERGSEGGAGEAQQLHQSPTAGAACLAKAHAAARATLSPAPRTSPPAPEPAPPRCASPLFRQLHRGLKVLRRLGHAAGQAHGQVGLRWG